MLNKIISSLSIIMFFCVLSVKAQDNFAQIKAVEDSLLNTADSMYNAFIPEERGIYNEKFVKQLIRALKMPNSYNYGFDSLAKKINIIYPDDKSFRIFNWVNIPSDVITRYYGAVQVPGEQLKLYPLIDCSVELGKNAEDSVLTNGRWYGALYYRIMANEVNGQTIYTLFGKNASGLVSNKKLMDPMYIATTGVVFGAPIFNVRSQLRPNERVTRFIIEYKKDVQASMNWDDDMKAVYFDKLVSQVNDPNRKYTFVPSGQYDGFRWNQGFWDYIQDLIPVDNLKDGNAPTPVPVKPRE